MQIWLNPVNRFINFTIFLILIIWVFLSGFWPIIEHWGNYSAIQAVWDRWQSWNTGIIALLSALIALTVTRHRYERDRVREFVTSKALLPPRLSTLMGYIRSAQACLRVVYADLGAENVAEGVQSPEVPELPDGYERWLEGAIRWGDREFVALMIHVVAHLQVYNARLLDLQQTYNDPARVGVRANISDYIIHGAIIYMEIGFLLSASRDGEKIPDSLSAENIESGLRQTGFYYMENFGIGIDRLSVRARNESEAIRRRMHELLPD